MSESKSPELSVSPPTPRGVSAAISPEAFRRLTDGSSSSTQESGGHGHKCPSGFKDKLKKEQAGIIKRRNGAVLSRGFILKTDHYPTGRALDLDFRLTDAPNWRSPKEESLNVYGVAQPTLAGVKSILSLLGCRPEEDVDGSGRRGSFADGNTSSVQKPSSAVWLCLREEPISECVIWLSA